MLTSSYLEEGKGIGGLPYSKRTWGNTPKKGIAEMPQETPWLGPRTSSSALGNDPFYDKGRADGDVRGPSHGALQANALRDPRNGSIPASPV
ncbi:hypothetical protein GCM10007874_38000 [Labrys miyagiensis]|uniref:Uncharacterized protein n=1 Tax=Labrys miyagiensis TaxID=346912 RepID=A0ABQ6CLY2_9HYPH|nr:hypothetical protein GCM10007874_38000 [Labrys miyagiensis]